jgi:hypothetical protein
VPAAAVPPKVVLASMAAIPAPAILVANVEAIM